MRVDARVFFMAPNLPDESDNHLFELAVAGGADFIVTRKMRDLKTPGLRFRLASDVAGRFLKEL